MTDLEKLIQWWEEQFDGHSSQWTDGQCHTVVATIKALKELKELKGE